MKQACKCHGTSGSCDYKTCWNETPDFRDVARLIKKKYQDAVVIEIDDGRWVINLCMFLIDATHLEFCMLKHELSSGDKYIYSKAK